MIRIERGVLNATKIVYANAAAIGTLAAHASGLIKVPSDIVKTVLAAAFFSVFMDFHMPGGPSELHFVGASAVYFIFGFIPTLLGFAIGLALQGLPFEPQGLVHLGVKSLSFMVPLIVTHMAFGRRFFSEGLSVSWRHILAFDARSHAGVVGFWLLLGDEATPLADWAIFALAYLPLVLCEPVFTFVVLRLMKKVEDKPLVRDFTAITQLSVA